MIASEAYGRLLDLGVATVETADVAAALRLTTSAATKLLGRLAAAKLIVRLRPGLWLLARNAPNPYALVDALTAPMPSYVSLQTALYLHGMIEQVPGVIYIASLARTQTIVTSVGVFSVHHIAPELFDGFELRADGTKLATPEKALFDVIYLSGGGAKLVKDVVTATYRQTRLVKNPQTANARGYLSYAYFKAQE